MKLYAYVRVSTRQQSLKRQIENIMSADGGKGDGNLSPGQEHQDPVGRFDVNIRDLVARGRDAGGGGLAVALPLVLCYHSK